MFNFIKKKVIENRVQDEVLFEYVLEEMESGVMIKGLHAKAIAYSDGDESKATSLYMKYRVQSIKDYFMTLKISYDDIKKEQVYDYIRNIGTGLIDEEDSTDVLKKQVDSITVDSQTTIIQSKEKSRQNKIEIDKKRKKDYTNPIIIISIILIAVGIFFISENREKSYFDSTSTKKLNSGKIKELEIKKIHTKNNLIIIEFNNVVTKKDLAYGDYEKNGTFNYIFDIESEFRYENPMKLSIDSIKKIIVSSHKSNLTRVRISNNEELKVRYILNKQKLILTLGYHIVRKD